MIMDWKKIESKEARVNNIKLVKNTWVNIHGDAISIYSTMKGNKKAWVVEKYKMSLKSYFKGFPIYIKNSCVDEKKFFMGKNAKSMAFSHLKHISNN